MPDIKTQKSTAFTAIFATNYGGSAYELGENLLDFDLKITNTLGFALHRIRSIQIQIKNKEYLQ